jgi:hypothetical protein
MAPLRTMSGGVQRREIGLAIRQAGAGLADLPGQSLVLSAPTGDKDWLSEA